MRPPSVPLANVKKSRRRRVCRGMTPLPSAPGARHDGAARPTMAMLALRDAADFDGLGMVLKSQAGAFHSARCLPICSVRTVTAADA